MSDSIDEHKSDISNTNTNPRTDTNTSTTTSTTDTGSVEIPNADRKLTKDNLCYTILSEHPEIYICRILKGNNEFINILFCRKYDRKFYNEIGTEESENEFKSDQPNPKKEAM